MNPGTKRHMIVVQSKTLSPTPDSYGGPVYTWSDYVTVWAEEWPLKGRDIIAAQSVNSEITTRFVTRYIPGITGSMRIVYKSQYYDIIGDPINTEGQDRELQIMAKRGINEG
jgi:SPP1 family predicted phage head-tail adaptor